MKVSEEQRRALFERVSAHLDEETATLLLEVIVPANVELATRGDIQELRAEMLLRFTELDGRLTGQITELDGRLTRQITDLDKNLTGRITDFDKNLTGQITELDKNLTGQITELDRNLTGRIAAQGKELTEKLYHRVLPSIAIMLSVATFLSWVAG